MSGTHLGYVRLLSVAALILALTPANALSDSDGEDNEPTIVRGAITALTDNTATDGTVTVTFSSTKKGTTTTTDVTLDSTTKILLNDSTTSLADFVTAVNAALADLTLPQYSGSAR